MRAARARRRDSARPWLISSPRRSNRARSRSSTSTTRSVRRMAANNSRSGTHIMTSAVLRRCTSITWRAAPRVATILRPARTPKGTEVRTVIKHVTKRLRRHWPHTRIVWRGDSHYGRVEAMDWAEDDGADYIFGLPGNAALDAHVTEIADTLRFHPAQGNQTKLRTYASF